MDSSKALSGVQTTAVIILILVVGVGGTAAFFLSQGPITQVVTQTQVQTQVQTQTPVQTQVQTRTQIQTQTVTQTVTGKPAETITTTTQQTQTVTTAPQVTQITEGPRFRFGDGVSAPDRRLIERVVGWLYQYWGAGIGPLTVYVYPEKEELLASYAADCTSGLLVFPPSACATILGRLSQRFPGAPDHFATAEVGALLVLASSQGPWATLSREARLEQLIHSTIHGIQSYWADGRAEPIWLLEGGAHYASPRIMAANGERDYGAVRRDVIRDARGMVVLLSDLEDPRRVRQDTLLYRAAHVVGFLAAEYLASRYGEAKIIDYWKAYRDVLRANGYWARGNEDEKARDEIARLSWPQAFKGTFGLSLKDFYEQFELYRATL